MLFNNTFNDLKTSLTEQDVDELVSIIGKGCRQATKTRLRTILTYSPSSIGNYGIFGRLEKYADGSWHYCAGQSYPDEIRTLKELILK